MQQELVQKTSKMHKKNIPAVPQKCHFPPIPTMKLIFLVSVELK